MSSTFELLTKIEAAKEVRVGLRTLEKHLKSGSGPAIVKIGGRVLIERGALTQWISRRTFPPNA